MSSNEKRVYESSVRRAKAVGELYYLHKREGITKLYVWRTYIWPEFHISYRTLDRCLDRQVNKELKSLGTPSVSPHFEESE